MKLITQALFTLFIFSNAFNSNAGRLPIEQITLELNKLNFKNLGIVIWDQREMVADKSQPETFLGYTRSMTGIAYGHLTKSQKTLVEILENKIGNAFNANNNKVGFIDVSPYESKGDLTYKIKNSSFDKVLVLKLNNLIFDGVMKIEYVVDIQTIIYSKNGEEIYGNTVLQKIPLGIVDKRKKTVPATLKTIIQDIFNNASLHTELEKEVESDENSNKVDVIITKSGDELEVEVIEITENTIKYKSADHLQGPLRSISIENVFMIKYSNGKKEVLNQ